MAFQLDQEPLQQRLELRHRSQTFERFIEPKRRENDIRPLLSKVMVQIAKVIRAWSQGDLVGAPRKVAQGEAFLGEALLQHRLELPMATHALEQGVADQHDALLRLHLQRKLGLNHRKRDK